MLITAGFTSRANRVGIVCALANSMVLGDVDRTQLGGVTGGLHIVHGIQNAKTGAWEWKQEFNVPDPKPPPPPTPVHITHGIMDAKTNTWIWKQEFDSLRP